MYLRKLKQRRIVSETKSLLFAKINKNGMTLARITKKRKMLIANVGNGKRAINTDLMRVRRTIFIAISMDEMHQFLATTTYQDP